jgi:NADPH:quinone reductase-like Zn-dependent oxidoreductase
MHLDVARMSVHAQPAERYESVMSIASERVIVTHRDHLELVPWQVPDPAAGEVRIRVTHSAVSFGDVMLRRHVFRRRPPVAVPGYEVVGTIDAVGSGAGGVRAGDRVAAFVEYGGNARHALVPARDVISLPDRVQSEVAAAAVLNYATALGMTEMAGLVAGDDFLVHGATGGVGTAMLDIARTLELRAIGATRNPTVDLFGAHMVDARSETLVGDVRAMAGGGVRAVFDSRAGRGLWGSRAMLRRGGSLVVFGLSSVANRGVWATIGTVGTLAALAVFAVLPGKRSSVFAIDRTFHRDPARVRGWVECAIDLLARDAIAPRIGARLPLARVADAHRLLETGAVVGKVVIDCQ